MIATANVNSAKICLDPESFAIGFVVGPVAYFAIGLAVYGAFLGAKWAGAPFGPSSSGLVLKR